MNAALKVISVLLSYPSEEIRQAIPEMKAALRNADIGATHTALLVRLADDIAEHDLYDAQERYVFLFDRTRVLSLHLFEHVHGESRDRGQAMVDLMAMYDADGLEIDTKELPDYLPMFLEYLSMKPAPQISELLGQTVHILAAIRERLKKRKSVYSNAFAVLEAMASAKPDPKLLHDLLETPADDPADLEALDRIWEEEAVTFGGNAGENACGPDRLQRQIRASNRRPADIPQGKTV